MKKLIQDFNIKILVIILSIFLPCATIGQNKSIVICYDDNDETDLDLKNLSQNLVTLISKRPEKIQAQKFTEDEIKDNKGITSQQSCLYIGENCSSSIKFDEVYNELGIHIGYNGKIAWIRCNKEQWTKAKFEKFESLLASYCKKYNMTHRLNEEYQKKDRIRILRQFKTGKEPWADKETLDYNSEESFSDRFSGIGASLLIFGDPMIRKYQYLLAALMFYDQYLNKFLISSGIKQSFNKQHINGNTITTEKKKQISTYLKKV